MLRCGGDYTNSSGGIWKVSTANNRKSTRMSALVARPDLQ